MIQCEACGRHLRAQEKGCPFCRKPRTRNIAVAMSAVLTPVVLAACYGAPDKWYEDTGDTADTGNAGLTVDLDEDGWDTTSDCDDANAAVNPEATEVCDDKIDNDCDDLIDADDKDCAKG